MMISIDSSLSMNATVVTHANDSCASKAFSSVSLFVCVCVSAR